MTLIQFIACSVCCLGPFFAVYKGTQVPTHQGTGLVIFASTVIYMCALFAKSLVAATIFPSSCADWMICQLASDLLGVAMDITGIYTMLNMRKSLNLDATSRLLCVGLGWSFGHILSSNSYHFLRAASPSNFCMNDFFAAASANVHLIFYLALTAAIYILSRKRDGFVFTTTAIATCFLILCPILTRHLVNSVSHSNSHSFVLQSGIGNFHIFALAANAAAAIALGAIIRHLYMSMQAYITKGD